jgi:hypothetical protein
VSYLTAMPTLDDTGLLLDLLREAGDEPVTLDELEIVGVRDAARALLELELAGHTVHRVYEDPARGRRVTCVTLTPPPPSPDLPDATDGRLLAGALLGALFVLLVAAARRR